MKIIQVIFSLFLLFGTIDGLETAGKLLCPRCLSTTTDGDACAAGTGIKTTYLATDACTSCVTVQISQTILSRGCSTAKTALTANKFYKIGSVLIGVYADAASNNINLEKFNKAAADAKAVADGAGGTPLTDAKADELKYDKPLECYSCHSLGSGDCTNAKIASVKTVTCSVCVTVKFEKGFARACYGKAAPATVEVAKIYKNGDNYYKFCTPTQKANKCNDKKVDTLFTKDATKKAEAFPKTVKVGDIKVPATTTPAPTNSTTDGGSGTKGKSSGNSMGLGLFTMVVATLVNL